MISCSDPLKDLLEIFSDSHGVVVVVINDSPSFTETFIFSQYFTHVITESRQGFAFITSFNHALCLMFAKMTLKFLGYSNIYHCSPIYSFICHNNDKSLYLSYLYISIETWLTLLTNGVKLFQLHNWSFMQQYVQLTTSNLSIQVVRKIL